MGPLVWVKAFLGQVSASAPPLERKALEIVDHQRKQPVKLGAQNRTTLLNLRFVPPPVSLFLKLVIWEFFPFPGRWSSVALMSCRVQSCRGAFQTRSLPFYSVRLPVAEHLTFFDGTGAQSVSDCVNDWV